MKNIFILSLLIFLSLPSTAQVTGEVDRLVAQWISQTELAETVIDKGAVVFDESDPSKLYIGDGQTLGGVQVSPPSGGWDHIATQDIYMEGNRLQLGDGFSLLQLGGYYAVSGNGEISDQPGEMRISANAVPLIKIKAGELLTQVKSLTWDPIEEQFSMVIVVGTNPTVPTIQTNDDLVNGTWEDITPASMGAVVDGERTVLIDYVAEWDVIFFRAVLPAQNPEIELLADTNINATLSVTGAITGPLNVTNLVGKVTSAQISDAVTEDIAEGVTAHSWGDHAAAGYLTEQTTVYTVGFFEAPEDDDLDWLLIARAAVIDDASPGQAYSRVIHTAETTYTITKNGSASLGTVVFPNDGNAGVITLSADITLAAGDRLEINAPATADATGADIQVSLIGVLQ